MYSMRRATTSWSAAPPTPCLRSPRGSRSIATRPTRYATTHPHHVMTGRPLVTRRTDPFKRSFSEPSIKETKHVEYFRHAHRRTQHSRRPRPDEYSRRGATRDGRVD